MIDGRNRMKANFRDSRMTYVVQFKATLKKLANKASASVENQKAAISYGSFLKKERIAVH